MKLQSLLNNIIGQARSYGKARRLLKTELFWAETTKEIEVMRNRMHASGYFNPRDTERFLTAFCSLLNSAKPAGKNEQDSPL